MRATSQNGRCSPSACPPRSFFCWWCSAVQQANKVRATLVRPAGVVAAPAPHRPGCSLGCGLGRGAMVAEPWSRSLVAEPWSRTLCGRTILAKSWSRTFGRAGPVVPPLCGVVAEPWLCSHGCASWLSLQGACEPALFNSCFCPWASLCP